MIKASVIGWPIHHSRSPLIHGYWLKQLGINGQYEKHAVAPEDLSHFINTLRHGDHVGTNVTLPHKETALSFVDEPDDRVRRIGALNTIWRENGRLCATTTDGLGFIANLQQTLPGFAVATGPITILGAGGSARAIIDEMLRTDADRIYVVNRTLPRAESLAQHFGPKVKAIATKDMAQALEQSALIINTTSAGLANDTTLEIPRESLQQNAVFADIVYTPLITPFLQTAKARGHAIVPGLGMLLHQAVVGFQKWFGQTPKVTQDLYDLIARDIDPGYHP